MTELVGARWRRVKEVDNSTTYDLRVGNVRVGMVWLHESKVWSYRVSHGPRMTAASKVDAKRGLVEALFASSRDRMIAIWR